MSAALAEQQIAELPQPPSIDPMEYVSPEEFHKVQADYQRKLKDWKGKQPVRNFRLRPNAGHHVQRDPDGRERTYKAIEGKVIQSRLNLAETWPEKFECVDAYASSDQNPYLLVPAPGELPEDFQRRMDRLKTQNKLTAAVAESAKMGGAGHIPSLQDLDPTGFDSQGVETRGLGEKPHPTNQVSSPTAPPPISTLPIVNQAPRAKNVDFDKMTVAQLKVWAEDNEVTLSPNLNDKAKIILEIRRGLDVK